MEIENHVPSIILLSQDGEKTVFEVWVRDLGGFAMVLCGRSEHDARQEALDNVELFQKIKPCLVIDRERGLERMKAQSRGIRLK